jgi:hypothetical protein
MHQTYFNTPNSEARLQRFMQIHQRGTEDEMLIIFCVRVWRSRFRTNVRERVATFFGRTENLGKTKMQKERSLMKA